MFTMQLAGHSFTIDNQYPYVQQLCRDYLTDGLGIPISITAEELAFEGQPSGHPWPEGYLESLAVYRKICRILLEYDILLFHCSALALDGNAFLFTGPSGVGKSTHTRLWRQQFGKQIVTINDDKPLLSVHPNAITVFGTPWAGKDGLQSNTMAKVAGIVVLRQGSKNVLCPMTCQEAFPILLNQTYRENSPTKMRKTMDLVAQLAHLPTFSLSCTISQEAVSLAYQALTGGML